MKLNDYQKEEGYEYESCFYPTATDLLQTGFLGFCGCGSPEENLLYIFEGLKLINDHYGNSDDCRDSFELYQKWNSLMKIYLEQSKYFFYYWLDKEGLIEHGSALPGWLTPKGHDFLDLLNEWKSSVDLEEEE